MFSISLSRILEGVQSSEIGLYEVGSVGGLLGLRIGMIFAIFQMLGMLLVWTDRLNMSVRALMPCGPKCFR